MTLEEMKGYVNEKLKEEYFKFLRNEENNYGYLFLIASDLGLAESYIDIEKEVLKEMLESKAENGLL